jgi:hypothetical protein
MGSANRPVGPNPNLSWQSDTKQREDDYFFYLFALYNRERDLLGGGEYSKGKGVGNVITKVLYQYTQP